jgi:glyoxylase-like metal-dependent hydrolase (beta-lactamase superfamily II)
MSDGSEPPGPWTRLGDDLHVRQSRAYWMNSTVLLDPEHTVIVDPGVLPSEIEDIARLVRQAEPEAITLILTHGHWDHVLGRPWWPKARVIAHDRCAAEVARDLAKIRRESDSLAVEHGEAWAKPFARFRVDEAVSGQRFVKLDPWRLVLRDAFGHCDSQLSIHLPEIGLLIAADMLSDIEPPLLNGPVGAYRRTLETLKPLADGGAFEALIPGHGAIAIGPDAVRARVDGDLAYLESLERGVAAARAAGLALDATQDRLATMEYTGKHSREYSMVEAHRKNVRLAWESAGRPA